MNLVESMMQRLLSDAGVAAGMRVLDAGCGHGNLSAMIAPMVLPGGAVLGIDRDADALDVARAKAEATGHPHLSFAQADVCAPLPDLGLFDAVVVRRVLMYLPEPVAALRNLVDRLRPGGILVVQEVDNTLRPATPQGMALHAKMHDWVWRTVAAEGADVSIGAKLGGLLTAAGIAVQEVRAGLNVQTPTQAYPTEATIRAIAHRVAARGVATPAEIEAEAAGLDERLAAERANGWKTWIGEAVVSAWGTKPD